MSEDNTTPTETRLDALKERAKTLGISFHPSIGEDKLAEKIKEALSDKPAVNDPDPDAGENEGTGDSTTTKPAPASVGEDSEFSDAKASKDETKDGQRRRKQREASELVRVIVTCMNPNKREYDGEIFCAGNRVIGTHKKFVPFDVEYHVPRVIYNMIKERQCQVFVTRRDDKGRQIREGKLIREFNVTVLDPLTQTELTELAQRQAMANGTAA